MSDYYHKNFAIDAFVDRHTHRCFNSLVEYTMAQLDPELSDDLKRRKAIDTLLDNNEILKLKKKKETAKKSCQHSLNQQVKRPRETEGSLLKWCLINHHERRKQREK
ncbi:hypothetical protein Zmor_021202 [Zophobas morio]|uniref:Uncharacterized protein n=1 Tax=Zophobas morio TaxID=2755281 RepID=A0AA38MAX3_9CUCU|nr:hypothetical protein Zmor_021202 [Zophobas morio]